MAKTVLLVEDNKDQSELVKKILSLSGFNVVVAANGKETMAYCKSHLPPALILMDIFLPDINGTDLTKEIKKLADYKKTVVIAVTIQASKDIEQQIIDSGCKAILYKPYLPEELVKVVKQNV